MINTWRGNAMSKAQFVFHGLFPDIAGTGKKQIPTAKVLFDVEFNGEFHSHLMADIELVEENGEQFFEVRRNLPFDCEDFPAAALQYYQYIVGPQQTKISHSGPKGASIATHNVVRAEWAVELEASPLHHPPN